MTRKKKNQNIKPTEAISISPPFRFPTYLRNLNEFRNDRVGVGGQSERGFLKQQLETLDHGLLQHRVIDRQRLQMENSYCWKYLYTKIPKIKTETKERRKTWRLEREEEKKTTTIITVHFFSTHPHLNQHRQYTGQFRQQRLLRQIRQHRRERVQPMLFALRRFLFLLLPAFLLGRRLTWLPDQRGSGL